MYLLGYDLGSSSIKAALVDINTQKTVGTAQYPDVEMEIIADQIGWAEQHPENWWENLVTVTKKLLDAHRVEAGDIKAIGIAYQMHGLVVVDNQHHVLRPSIIWCDSRAVEIGNQAFDEIGHERCLQALLNSPGNFTASKLKWVKDNEPAIFDKIYKFMLPGDYIGMKMTGQIATTVSGLSEGILWDFQKNTIAGFLLEAYGISTDLVPDIVPTCGDHGSLTSLAASELGLAPGIPVSYRAGDQPNNALSLNVLESGDIAATGGTSGVVYGISDKAVYDPASRVNAFAHVNHRLDQPSIGILLCINGAGIQYSWIKNQLVADGFSYDDMEMMLQKVPINSDGLQIIPFGNGAERILENKNIGSRIINLNFNTHKKSHLYRAALEGIAFSFIYGVDILKKMGLNIETMRVGNDNLFQSNVFSNTIAGTLNCTIEVVKTTGAVGAAKAAGVSPGFFNDLREANQGLEVVKLFEPDGSKAQYDEGFGNWKNELEKLIK